MREDEEDEENEEDEGSGVKRTDEASHDELDLAVRGNDDSHHDGRDIGELLHVGRSDHEGPCSEESGNHIRCLFLEKRTKSAFPLPIPRTEAEFSHTFNI